MLLIGSLKTLLLLIVLLLGIGAMFVIAVAIAEIVELFVLPRFDMGDYSNSVSPFGRLAFVSSFVLMITRTFYPFLDLILYIRRW